jgi:hypothetical protein
MLASPAVATRPAGADGRTEVELDVPPGVGAVVPVSAEPPPPPPQATRIVEASARLARRRRGTMRELRCLSARHRSRSMQILGVRRPR